MPTDPFRSKKSSEQASMKLYLSNNTANINGRNWPVRNQV